MFLTCGFTITMMNKRMKMRIEMQRMKRMKMTRRKRMKIMTRRTNQDGDEDRRWFDPPSDERR